MFLFDLKGNHRDSVFGMMIDESFTDLRDSVVSSRATGEGLTVTIPQFWRCLYCGVGKLEVSYSATIYGNADPAPVSDYDLSLYLRPSRYAEADKFFGFAATEFGSYEPSEKLLAEVSSWVGSRLSYVPGSSDPIDGAADTLLAGAGVCRDYTHLVVALLRAVNVPARLVAVYAPGCDPMDFHAVAEAFVDGRMIRGIREHLSAILRDIAQRLAGRGRGLAGMQLGLTPANKL